MTCCNPQSWWTPRGLRDGSYFTCPQGRALGMELAPDKSNGGVFEHARRRALARQRREALHFGTARAK